MRPSFIPSKLNRLRQIVMFFRPYPTVKFSTAHINHCVSVFADMLLNALIALETSRYLNRQYRARGDTKRADEESDYTLRRCAEINTILDVIFEFGLATTEDRVIRSEIYKLLQLPADFSCVQVATGDIPPFQSQGELEKQWLRRQAADILEEQAI